MVQFEHCIEIGWFCLTRDALSAGHTSSLAPFSKHRGANISEVSTHDILIRNAVIEDMRSCAQLIADEELDDAESWQKRFETDLNDANRRFFVALVGQKIVGYGHSVLHLRPEDADPDASPSGYFLAGLLVAPDHRRSRIGTQLTIARLEALRELTTVVFYLAIPENIATINLHMRLGFVEVCPVKRDGVAHQLFRLDII